MSAAFLTEISRGPTESDHAGLSPGDPVRSGSPNMVSPGDSPFPRGIHRLGTRPFYPHPGFLKAQPTGASRKIRFPSIPTVVFPPRGKECRPPRSKKIRFPSIPTGRFLYLLATLLRNASSAGIFAYLGWGRLESLGGFLRTLSLTERFLPACGVLLSPLRPPLDRRVLGFGGQGMTSPPGTLPPLRPLPDHPFLVLPLPTQPTAILLLRPPLFRVLRGTRGP